ncbi:MAG: iron-sulfur cluster assembly scaffold protein [archaeon]
MTTAKEYTKKVIEIFKKPKFVGEIKNPSGVGEVGNAVCGDMMTVYIKVKDNKITDIKFKTFGCVAAIASSEALCALAKGKTIEKALKITSQDIADYLGGLPNVKHHCSILGSSALKKAIEDYKKKKLKK